jgi:hypothetical protein
MCDDVRTGDIWIVNGRHVFLCGDVEQGALTALARATGTGCDVVYTDPPWSAGNYKYWRTHAQRQGPSDWCAFLEALLSGINTFNPYDIWIEMGISSSDVLRCARDILQLPYDTHYTVFYGNPRRPNHLVHFGAPVTSSADGLYSEAVTRWAFGHFPHGASTVLDPCVGRGMTARMAHRYGLTCYGIEINPRRLAQILAWFARSPRCAHIDCLVRGGHDDKPNAASHHS